VCREELPSVNRVYTEFKDRGLAVLLINFREGAALVQRPVRERGYVAPVLLDTSGDVTGRRYGVWGPPTFFFVNRSGRLIGRGIGARGWDSPAAAAFLRALLEPPS
jgi:hypothetical protein